MKQGKEEVIASALATIEKNYGKGSILRLGDAPIEKPAVIPTGVFSIDLITGIGGLPRGRIIEIYGPESSGKTTLALHVIAEAQRMGESCVFVDAEHALDTVYAASIGVNVPDLMLSQPDYGEQALGIVDTLVRTSAFGVIVVDSVAALVPRSEIEGEVGDSHVAIQARLMSQALRRLASAVNTSKTVVIFINQLRQKIGVMFGNNEVTTGGNALKFYASMRFDIRRAGQQKKGNEVLGNQTKIKIVKNKLAPPFKQTEVYMTFGKGISKAHDIVALAVQNNIIERSGAWFSYKTNRFQGLDNLVLALEQDPVLYNEIYQEVYNLYFPSEST